MKKHNRRERQYGNVKIFKKYLDCYFFRYSEKGETSA